MVSQAASAARTLPILERGNNTAGPAIQCVHFAIQVRVQAGAHAESRRRGARHVQERHRRGGLEQASCSWAVLNALSVEVRKEYVDALEGSRW